ncbi:epoxide hydrolase family protein [Chelatococcus reniformis]|uniref:Epoxide hydrolase n=1 Tax=Chelatococcus reniformis TaxID=1494448 RepID=A0A916XE10_9HYPH|nr:epoxide hydrolase [Chelatococcus reniformis]GGC64960.1 epoxide hydrolase [Chelatococcus reniformis]
MSLATSTTPFRIAVPDADLAAIRERVRAYDWSALPDAGGWSAGTDLAFMRDIAAYWLDGYDWRAEETKLNRFAQFKAKADGLDVHFIHVRGSAGPDGRKPLPLLLSHGWPGSFFEFLHIIEPLAHPERFGGDVADAFDVIVPSLPGYGFSGRPERPIGPRRIAVCFNALMTDVLGYDRYIAQGGDWGSSISGWLGYDHEACIGVHLNMVPALSPLMKPDSEEEKAYAQRMRTSMDAEAAYLRLQGTKPQTLAFGLMDSPVGVAAWIIEKFAAWSDLPRAADGSPDLLACYSRDQLLTNVMIYLVTKSFATAAWLYRGRLLESPNRLPAGRVETPTGVAAFPEPVYPPPPRSLAAKGYNLVRWTDMPRGGHFAALEEPDLLMGEIRAFARTLR